MSDRVGVVIDHVASMSWIQKIQCIYRTISLKRFSPMQGGKMKLRVIVFVDFDVVSLECH